MKIFQLNDEDQINLSLSNCFSRGQSIFGKGFLPFLIRSFRSQKKSWFALSITFSFPGRKINVPDKITSGKWLLLLLRGLFGGIARLFGVTGESFRLGSELDDAVSHECIIRDTNNFCRF